MTVDTTPTTAARQSRDRGAIAVMVGCFAVGVLGLTLAAGAAEADTTASPRQHETSHTHVVRRGRMALAKAPVRRRPAVVAASTDAPGATPVAAPASDVWLPEGVTIDPSRPHWGIMEDPTVSRLRWGCALERWRTTDKVRAVSMGPVFESIRAHYGTYHRAMLVLTGEDLPQS